MWRSTVACTDGGGCFDEFDGLVWPWAVVLSASTSVVWNADGTQASKTTAGVDIRGSTSLSVRRGSTTRELAWYDPYGKPRSAASIAGTERGYIGQYEDTATGLSYLNNRYHDPTLGTFISVDPLVNKTGEPYIYASGNPTTLSDPTGLEPCSWRSSVETRHDGKGQVQLKKSLKQTRAGCFGGCGSGPHGSVLGDDLECLEEVVIEADLGTDWAHCMIGSSVEACGVPDLPADDDVGRYRPSSAGEYNDLGGKDQQLWHCALGGATCRDLNRLGNIAAGVGANWRLPSEYGDDRGNALQHAFGFTLFSGRTGESDEFLVGFGEAHERDGRDGWVDSARDLLNNEVGVRLGNGLTAAAPQSDYEAAVITALLDGLLFCSESGTVRVCG
jgi:RHS repeat-associated protein